MHEEVVLDLSDATVVKNGVRILDGLTLSIRAGENSGRKLPHRDVVRELVALGEWNGGAASFQLPAAKKYSGETFEQLNHCAAPY